MIKIAQADEKFQRCNSCYKKNVMAVTAKPPKSNHSQTLHFCWECLYRLSDGIKVIGENGDIEELEI